MYYFNIPKKGSLLLSCLFLVSCGANKNWFKGANLGVRVNQYGEVKATAGIAYDLGGFQLPTFIIPIVDPNDPNKDLGQINLTRHGLAFQLHINNFLGMDKGAGLLPNGEGIPMIGLKGIEVTEFSSRDSNNTVYIAAGAGVSMIGVAIEDERFKEFFQDKKGFRSFEMNGIKGSIGVFQNKITQKSGVAIFFDMSSAITPDQLIEVGEGALLDHIESNKNLAYNQSRLNGINRD